MGDFVTDDEFPIGNSSPVTKSPIFKSQQFSKSKNFKVTFLGYQLTESEISVNDSLLRKVIHSRRSLNCHFELLSIINIFASDVTKKISSTHKLSELH